MNFSLKSILVGTAKNICPRCQLGQVFRGFYSMNKSCPSCNLVFERENGYFLGSMVFGYFLGVATLIPTLLLLVFYFHAEIGWIIAVPSIQVILLNPVLFRLSRLAWLHLDQQIDPR